MVTSILERDSFMQPSKIPVEPARGLFARVLRDRTGREEGNDDGRECWC